MKTEVGWLWSALGMLLLLGLFFALLTLGVATDEFPGLYWS